ncbi:hypothetical protein [Actinoplanes sp. NPDC051851]|uniref:hypothetical protein n=1 Tax=Actinoplanes sp. NPDC051851 TaxID=3154753 RepID=UPI00343DB832
MPAFRTAAALGAVLAAGPIAVLDAPPAYASGTPAAGVYRLTGTSRLPGQAITLTELSLTGNADDSLQNRQIHWGDGASESLGDGSRATHRYRVPGAYRVTIWLTDMDGDSMGTFPAGDTVTVLRVRKRPGTRVGCPAATPSGARPVSSRSPGSSR